MLCQQVSSLQYKLGRVCSEGGEWDLDSQPPHWDVGERGFDVSLLAEDVFVGLAGQ